MAEWEKTSDGRWTKFTDENRNLILLAVRAGNWLETACAGVGITGTTLEMWRRRGKADDDAGNDTTYAHFYRDLIIAEAQIEQEMLGYWTQAAKKNYEAAVSFLRMRFPKRYARGADRDQAPMQGLANSLQGTSIQEVVMQLAGALSNADEQDRKAILDSLEEFMRVTASLDEKVGLFSEQ